MTSNGEFREESFTARGIRKFLVSHQQKDNKSDFARALGSGCLRTVRIDEMVATVRAFTCSREDKPQTYLSQRQQAEHLGCSQRSIKRMQDDGDLHPVKHQKVTKLMAKQKIQRLARAQALIVRLTLKVLERTVFSDEKSFLLDLTFNPQNDCVYETGRKSDIAD